MLAYLLNQNNRTLKLVIFGLIFSFSVVGFAAASSGGWTKKDYAIQGTWSIEERGNKQVVTLSDSFSTKNGPDLKIFLSPMTVEEVTGKTATKGSVLISRLKNSEGSQEYVIPADVDLSKYKSILIHCEKYSVLWGGADL